MTKTALLAMPASPSVAARSMAGLAAYCGAFTVLLLVGALALSSEGQRASHTAEWHAIFALLLSVFVAARCLWNWNASTNASSGMRRNFDQLTARTIYVLLYMLSGYQLAIDMAGRSSLHMEHCQFFLSCGVLAVLFIRVCAALRRRSFAGHDSLPGRA